MKDIWNSIKSIFTHDAHSIVSKRGEEILFDSDRSTFIINQNKNQTDMGKSEIIQRLLDQGHITVAEAMTLMTTEPQTVYYQTPYQHPSTRMDPPWEVTCDTK
jgi:hypothetical protein